MKGKSLIRFYRYLKSHEPRYLISSSLAFTAAMVICINGAEKLLNVLISWLSSEVLVGNSFNLMFANALIAISVLMASLPFFIAAYFLLEAHSMGIKLSFGLAAIMTLLSFLGNFSTELGAVTATLCVAAAGINIANNRRKLAPANSAIVTEKVIKLGLRFSGLLSISLLVGMFIYIGARAIGYINWEFLTGKWNTIQAKDAIATGAGTIGGISDFIIGSFLIVGLCEAIAIPLGIGAAIFLSEYAKENKLTATIRFFIETLAGAPSIVIGMVGYFFFVTQLGWDYSLLGGAISLAFMILPWNIRVTEESMRAVPQIYREGAYALGATKWQTVKHIVLYASSPGIITGILLGLGAAIGETAVIMLTAGSFGVETMPRSISLTNAPIPTLPVWIYNAFKNLISGGRVDPSRRDIVVWESQNVCLAGAFVLMVIFLAICLVALFARNYLYKKTTGQ